MPQPAGNYTSIEGRLFGLARGVLEPFDVFLCGAKMHGMLFGTDYNLTATGTAQASGLAMINSVNHFGTVASGTFALLPRSTLGLEIDVINDGANTLQVCPSLSEPGSPTIDGIVAATGVSVSAARRSRFKCVRGGVAASGAVAAVSAVWVSMGWAKST